VTEAEWLACDDLYKILHYLRCEAKVVRAPKGRRKLRLFACGCCRQVWLLIEDHRSRRLVELSEQWADGLTDAVDLADAEVAARAAKSDADVASVGMSCMTHVRKVGAAVHAALHTSAKQAAEAARRSSFCALCSVGGQWSIGTPNPAWETHETRQAALARCIFGNPFATPPRVEPAWLRWNDGTVRRIAEGIYVERAFERMGILADALLDSGCTDEGIMQHCREQGSHARGCWVIDLLLGKE
jgi:hypothetical protein